jgi:uncharacterized protein YkuJ
LAWVRLEYIDLKRSSVLAELGAEKQAQKQSYRFENRCHRIQTLAFSKAEEYFKQRELIACFLLL